MIFPLSIFDSVAAALALAILMLNLSLWFVVSSLLSRLETRDLRPEN